MRIGVDARLYGLEHAGLGRYVLKLVEKVLKFDKKNHYVLFVRSKYKDSFKKYKNVKVVVVNIPIYGFLEQLILPIYFYRENLDLLHVPHFNAPILYFKPFVLTIHDLIKHSSKGAKTTTRNPGLYFIKRLGYLFLMKVITARSSGIAVPSQYVKNDLVSRLRVSPEKILVTYEAVAGSIKEVVLSKEEKTHVLREYALTQPFLVYTGSVYPHKNVDLLIDAIEKHNSVKEVDLVLAIICSRSIFWQRLQKNINDRGLQNIVKLLGFVDDSGVSKIYSLALALVHPSKMEGFGLTGLEAMGVGLPVISSNATCLPEVYGDAALYFDPNNINDLVEKIEKLIGDSSLREEMSTKGYMQSRKYTWDKMGKETILLYKKHYKK